MGNQEIFTQVKFINDTSSSPPTIETLEVPANDRIKEIKELV